MSRFTLDFTEDAAERIDQIAKAMGLKTKAEVLRKAITLLGYAVKQQKDGGRLIFENKKSNERKEIVRL